MFSCGITIETWIKEASKRLAVAGLDRLGYVKTVRTPIPIWGDCYSCSRKKQIRITGAVRHGGRVD
jgi:hypothetical protein